MPGLGLLALPDAPARRLAGYDLHTGLSIEAVLPEGTRHAGSATVEEITRQAQTQRGLLLDLGALAHLPAGTEIWLLE
ncbi:hypothetical protein GCM10023185_03740 [Hymenobacter saemangeumensis]|uniref:Uncharacterized protein n=1 Tax=Hymenobacter saemangeumensis TaxID=1084522 RepID=A0ABP8HZG5_9BACT